MVGLEEATVSKEYMCQIKQLSEMIVTQIRKSFDETVVFCKAFCDAEIAVAVDEGPANNMENLLEHAGHSSCANDVYTGYTEREEEGKFVNVTTHEKMSWSNWGPGHPNNIGNKQHYLTIQQFIREKCMIFLEQFNCVQFVGSYQVLIKRV